MRAFLRFNLVGALGMAVQLGTFALLVMPAGLPYLIATPVAVSAAIIHNFVWHRRWTWAGRAHAVGAGTEFVRFIVANGAVSIFGNVVVTAALVGVFRIKPVLANAAAVALLGLLNFHLSDRAVFRAKKPRKHRDALCFSHAPLAPSTRARLLRRHEHARRSSAEC